ncbi:hypothetical protein ACTFIY_008688 [Dictyostelium cf. discoideum]
MTRIVFSKEEVEIIQKYMDTESPENISDTIRKELGIERCSSSIRTKIKNLRNTNKTNSAASNMSNNINGQNTQNTQNTTPTPQSGQNTPNTTPTVQTAPTAPTAPPATVETNSQQTVPSLGQNQQTGTTLDNFLDDDLDSASQTQISNNKKRKTLNGRLSPTSSHSSSQNNYVPTNKGRVSFSDEMIHHFFYKINNMENIKLLFCDSSLFSVGEATFSIGLDPTIIIPFSRLHPINLLKKHTYKQQVNLSEADYDRLLVQLPPESKTFKYCKNSIEKFQDGGFTIFRIKKIVIEDDIQ